MKSEGAVSKKKGPFQLEEIEYEKFGRKKMWQKGSQFVGNVKDGG